MSVPNIKTIGNLSDGELKQLHDRIHAMWQSVPTEDVWNYHKLLVSEMMKRGMKHKNVDDLDDELVPLGVYPQSEDVSKLSVEQLKGWHTLIHHFYKNSSIDKSILSNTHELIVSQLHLHNIAHGTPLEEEQTEQQLAVIFNETVLNTEEYRRKEQELLDNKVKLSRLMIERMSKR